MRRFPPFAAAALLALSAAACGEGEEAEGPLMSPGEDCLACHGFKAAGTVYASASAAASAGLSGVTVRLEDGDGTVVTLTTNAAGNFFTSDPDLSPPYDVTISSGADQATMNVPRAGSCNGCHDAGARIALPAP